ncbi:hypothetical protein K466DRAFT_589945 [Polyporus arcularius HHB13444]|uniref:Uncharacterized protein n=1 Tax=Polyporus arcularius HHB13444 TaxID=1314778 RepID=A0A5C3P2V5_9APHY|nr:hypothetical protein K466DRAFT_589945 [Polyporus arcularius HHB13444]
MSEACIPAKPVVALNTIHSIAVDGLACCNDGTPTKMEIKRTAPDCSKTMHYDWNSPNDETALLPAIPTPPQPELPPESRRRRYVGATSRRGLGTERPQLCVRCENHERRLDSLLRATIGHQFKGRNLSEEAGMYQDLACLQGSIIPRCYGYFSATVDHTQMTILTWDGPDCSYPRTFDPHVPPHPSAPLSVLNAAEAARRPYPYRQLLRDHRAGST